MGFVGILEVGDRPNLGLAGSQEHGAFLRSLSPRLIIIEHDHDGIELLKPLKVRLERLQRTRRSRRNRHDGPLVAEELAHGERINLSLDNRDHAATVAPKMHPIQRKRLGVSDADEVLGGKPQFLCNDFAITHILGGLNRLALELADAVLEEATSLFGDPALLEGGILNRNQICPSGKVRYLNRSGGILVVLAPEAVAVAIRVAG